MRWYSVISATSAYIRLVLIPPTLPPSSLPTLPPLPPRRYYPCLHLFCSVADPGCLSQIRIFSIPDPRYLSILTQKNFSKLSSSRIRIPDRIWIFLPIPGSRGQKGTGSRIRIRNTALLLILPNYIEFPILLTPLFCCPLPYVAPVFDVIYYRTLCLSSFP
jgi:hypothetical protein